MPSALPNLHTMQVRLIFSKRARLLLVRNVRPECDLTAWRLCERGVASPLGLRLTRFITLSILYLFKLLHSLYVITCVKPYGYVRA